MLTFIRCYLIIQPYIILMIGLFSCQSQTPASKTDVIIKLAVHYLNANMPDSLYQLTDKEFAKHITQVMWVSSYKEKIVPLLPLTNVTFITSNDSVSIYKVDAKCPLPAMFALISITNWPSFILRLTRTRSSRLPWAKVNKKRICLPAKFWIWSIAGKPIAFTFWQAMILKST